MFEIEQELPLTIVAGASFHLPVTFMDDDDIPIDLTGYTARMQARSSVNAEDPAIFDLTTENGAIVIDGPTGTIDITMPVTQTENLAQDWDGEWDLFLYAYGSIGIQLLKGPIHISGRVTK